MISTELEARKFLPQRLIQIDDDGLLYLLKPGEPVVSSKALEQLEGFLVNSEKTGKFSFPGTDLASAIS